MSDVFWAALVTGLCTLAAVYITKRSEADRDYRRRLAKMSREKALERINGLYKPLLSMLDPGPPYEGIQIGREDGGRMIDFVDKQELLASPDLLNVIWQFKQGYHSPTGEIPIGLEYKIFEVVSREYDELKALLGYGKILKDVGVIRKAYRFVAGWLSGIYGVVHRRIFVWRVKMRRRVDRIRER